MTDIDTDRQPQNGKRNGNGTDTGRIRPALSFRPLPVAEWVRLPVCGLLQSSIVTIAHSNVFTRHLYGDSALPPKNLTIPQTAAKLCAFRITLKSYHQPLDTIFKGQNALNLVFGRGNELQIYFGNIFQSTINTGHYSSLSNQNSAKFMPKMYRNTFGGRAPPKPAGEFMRSSRPSRRNGGPTSKGRDGRGEREGAYF